VKITTPRIGSAADGSVASSRAIASIMPDTADRRPLQQVALIRLCLSNDSSQVSGIGFALTGKAMHPRSELSFRDEEIKARHCK
jgi:hypothetical protein